MGRQLKSKKKVTVRTYCYFVWLYPSTCMVWVVLLGVYKSSSQQSLRIFFVTTSENQPIQNVVVFGRRKMENPSYKT